MTTVAMIAARMGSTRQPGKVLRELYGAPMLQWVVDTAETARMVDETWICTTTEPRDDAIADYLGHCNIWRGPEEDVLRRFADCARHIGLKDDDLVVRLTGDCPFLDPRVVDEVIMLQKRTDCAYANNVDPASYPDGLDTQVVTVKALYEADDEAMRLSDRNTVVEFIGRRRGRYPAATLICPLPGLAFERWVVDTAEDFKFAEAVAEKLGLTAEAPSLISILNILDRWPEIRQINAGGIRNERFYAAIASVTEEGSV